MGNNQAYSAFQFTIITLYDRGVLDLNLLDTFANEYRGTDIDSGGKDYTFTAKDGKDEEAIAISLVDPTWTLGEPTVAELEAYDNDRTYWESEQRYDKWSAITSERWGWR